MFITKSLHSKLKPKQVYDTWQQIRDNLNENSVRMSDGLWGAHCSVKLANNLKTSVDVVLCESLDHIQIPKVILTRPKTPQLIWFVMLDGKEAVELLSIRLTTLREYLKPGPDNCYKPQDDTPLRTHEAHLGALATDRWNIMRLNLNSISETDSLWFHIHCLAAADERQIRLSYEPLSKWVA